MEYYTIKETADILKKHPETIRNYIRNGDLIASKVGRTWRIHEGHIQGFINQGYKQEEENE